MGADYLSLDDFEPAARRRLPRPLFQYIRGGVEADESVTGNRNVFRTFSFAPRVLRDVGQRSLQTDLLGRTYALPVGIAPMGISALSTYRGDLVLARAASAMTIPMVVSATSLIPMEEIVAANPDAWFQAYLPGDEAKIALMLERVECCGFQSLVITVDIPVIAHRERVVRAGFTTPLRPSFRLAWDGLIRPRWLLGVLLPTLLRHGMPHFENSSHARGAPVISARASRDFSGQSRLTWAHVAEVRRRWKGRLIIKGILSPEDAHIAREQGVDAIVASNHGGRQLDGALSPLLILPEIAAQAKGMPVLIDGGFRRGTDVIKALALGASFVFVGRPFAYAAAVGGGAAVQRAIDLLGTEIDRNMAMLGYTAIGEITSYCLRRSDGTRIVPDAGTAQQNAGQDPYLLRQAEAG